MNERQWRRKSEKRIYPVYERYITSLDSENDSYLMNSSDNPGVPNEKPASIPIEDPSPLADDTSLPEWFDLGALKSGERGFRAFHLLQSIFSERLTFLARSLYELEISSRERQEITDKALEEIDQDIEDCERYLAVLKGLLNNRERRRELERKVMELKRERRQLMVSSWRDILNLQMLSRRLKQNLDSLAKTGDIQGGSDE